MKDQTQLLIDILLDKTAREDERHDAAMDLGEYKDLRALEALAQVASDSNEEDYIVDSSAESIGEICVALNYFDESLYKQMIPFAQEITFGFIMAYNSELIKHPLRDELAKEFNQ